MKSIIKRILSEFYNKPIYNLFNENHEKRVLISYIVYPFKKKHNFSHSNSVESLEIAKIFNKLGYIVDVYNYTYSKKINFENYDVVFGIGKLFENAVQFKHKKIIFIYYATGAYFCFQNRAELERLQMLYERKNILLKPKRFVKNSMFKSSHLTDSIIVIGNNWTISTYESSKSPKFKVPQSVYDVKWKTEVRQKNVINNKNFLWFGSSGLVHKGLDLTLEVFKNLEDFNLYICGPKEDDFFDTYKDELSLSNIHYLGFLDINSRKFKDVIDKCNFSIFPSCSEGGCGSLLQTMSFGLIPIATIETGVDFIEYGYVITKDVEEIKQNILQISKINQNKLTELSNGNSRFIEKNHSINNFKIKIKENLEKILKWERK
jgi:hypothetical protein